MALYGAAVLFTFFVWWFSTGAVMYAVGLPERVSGWTLAVATGVLAAALYGLAASSADTTVWGAYLAFTCALLVWGWCETTFLLGVITGPRTTPCPPEAQGWTRFRNAVAAIITHELAILLAAVAIAVLTWDAPNLFGLWTFLILWIMRLSAKFNLYLGVPNLSEELLPPRLAFMASYFRKKPMNALFPVSVTGATVATLWLAQAAAVPGITTFTASGMTLLATLMALAVLEHWFMVLPLPAAALWGWGLGSRQTDSRKQTGKPEAIDTARHLDHKQDQKLDRTRADAVLKSRIVSATRGVRL